MHRSVQSIIVVWSDDSSRTDYKCDPSAFPSLPFELFVMATMSEPASSWPPQRQLSPSPPPPPPPPFFFSSLGPLEDETHRLSQVCGYVAFSVLSLSLPLPLPHLFPPYLLAYLKFHSQYPFEISRAAAAVRCAVFGLSGGGGGGGGGGGVPPEMPTDSANSGRGMKQLSTAYPNITQ